MYKDRTKRILMATQADQQQTVEEKEARLSMKNFIDRVINEIEKARPLANAAESRRKRTKASSALPRAKRRRSA